MCQRGGRLRLLGVTPETTIGFTVSQSAADFLGNSGKDGRHASKAKAVTSATRRF